MKRYLSVIFMLLPAFTAFAAFDDADMVLESFEGRFTMSNPSSAQYKVHEVWQINNESGLSAAEFEVTEDAFRKLSSFSVTVIKDGRKTRIPKTSFANVATGGAFVDDIYTTYYKEEKIQPPFTMEVDYTLVYKGFTFFPVFSPISFYGQAVGSASLILDLPAGTQIAWQGNVEPVVQHGKTDVWTWSVHNLSPVHKEHFMPALSEIMPVVHAHPVSFSFGGFQGSQSDWKSVGSWLTGVMQGTDNLSDAKKAELNDMVSKSDDTVGRIKILYDYLGKSTRYVNISLGIGGYKPISASRVTESGYGDCKALSNYMKSMLDAIGVESYYCIVSTSDANMPEKLHSVGLMNHAILCVPLKDRADTLWLECTNPKLPFGYAHSSIAGHQVLVVDGDNSRIVRVKEYPDNSKWFSRNVRVVVGKDGSVAISGVDRDNLRYAESTIGLTERSKTVQDRYLTSGIAFMPEKVKLEKVENNFGDYQKDGSSFEPCSAVHYSMNGKNFARNQYGALMLPVSPFKNDVSAQRSSRKNNVYSRDVFTRRDTVSFFIPDGFQVEALPKDVNVSCPWASYSVEYKMSGGVVRVYREYRRTARGEWPKEDYEQWRKFTKAVRLDMESFIPLTSSH